MIVNNIFTAIGNFFTNVAFRPYDMIRFMQNWWAQNTFAWILIIIGMAGFIYWMTELNSYRKAGTE